MVAAYSIKPHGMEREALIGGPMMANAEARYRSVGANGIVSETVSNSSTDEEMLDISTMTTEAPFEYTDLADKSQGQ